MTHFISYYRVSTERQGRSGLGLEAQREAVTRFLRADDRVVGEYVEIESGKADDRPQLAAAMKACRQLGAVLLIGKLDRLSRRVSFIATMMESGIKFIAADMPDADPFRLHIEAAIAEEERRRISARTKAALQVAKAKGKVLGGYRGVAPTDEARTKGRARQSEAAQRRAASVLPVLEELQASGLTSPGRLAKALNDRAVKAPRGGSWAAPQVRRLLQMAAA